MSVAETMTRPTMGAAESVLNSLPHPLLVVGPDGKIIEANAAAESFFAAVTPAPPGISFPVSAGTIHKTPTPTKANPNN